MSSPVVMGDDPDRHATASDDDAQPLVATTIRRR